MSDLRSNNITSRLIIPLIYGSRFPQINRFPFLAHICELNEKYITFAIKYDYQEVTQYITVSNKEMFDDIKLVLEGKYTKISDGGKWVLSSSQIEDYYKYVVFDEDTLVEFAKYWCPALGTTNESVKDRDLFEWIIDNGEILSKPNLKEEWIIQKNK